MDSMAAPRLEDLPALVAALGAGDAAVTEAAARALSKFAGENNANRVAIAQAGAITPLIKLVRLGSDGAKKVAVVALLNLANNDANAAAIAAAGGLAPLEQLARDGETWASEALDAMRAAVEAQAAAQAWRKQAWRKQAD